MIRIDIGLYLVNEHNVGQMSVNQSFKASMCQYQA